MKLPIHLLDHAEAEFPKAAEDITRLRATIATKSARELDGLEHFALRRSMIAASAREPAEIAFERYIDGNQLVSVNYLQIGLTQSKAVGRIRYFDKTEQKTVYATGFMVTPELMLTNHHVLPAANAAELSVLIEDAVLEFDFEFDSNGQRRETVAHRLDPDAFFHSHKELDMAIVAVHPLDITGKRRIDEHGYLVLNGRLGKAGTGDFATIIQHPDGKEKQIALRNNEIIDRSLADAIVYKSDTAQGSSGAPVFNDEWQVIALHSAGVAKKDEQGNYLDKDGNRIEVLNGRVDEARVCWISNRGIRISAIVDHLASAPGIAEHALIQPFTSPSYTDSRPFRTLPRPAPRPDESMNERTDTASSSAPRLPASTPPIEIHIRIGTETSVVPLAGISTAAALPLLESEKKLEDDQDFTACLGFDEEFMGVRIPLPVPGAKLRKKLANLRDSPASCVLRYHHYSTFQHAVRRVPVLSAINVHGKFRYGTLDESTRKDKWLRDNRVDYDVQLDDKWYAKSGFDKGHLSRREDAEWGTSENAALLSANMTCSYANAVPQVPAFNRAVFGYHGKWGRLEQELLEQGVEDESGQAARLCVFSGPIFGDDDPTYAAVQVALRFFKVVVWRNATGELKTTAFRLSQENLVDGIEFEALRFDKLYDMDQVSLSWVEEATQLAFPAVMHDSDTYKK
ncbi:DNA/RNA non-specific endonuclease [Cupriavidus taiwanensis]|uniref:DNA/RNA non-specific endonuclease n=1 Tax=Cupriavidus taiwanensis TaxID=164546 RepID=UPI0025418B53|nr:DNA/RNA non-specific endonuclease [Cupriavidus taiwanensis]MDK3025465.1 DNA/RNA non-specific endonuclease [Cupriavidus taiwanensis]